MRFQCIAFFLIILQITTQHTNIQLLEKYKVLSHDLLTIYRIMIQCEQISLQFLGNKTGLPSYYNQINHYVKNIDLY